MSSTFSDGGGSAAHVSEDWKRIEKIRRDDAILVIYNGIRSVLMS